VSEANCIHVHVPGRAWREKTYKIQRADLIREAHAEVNAGRAVILAGDLNTGKFFTGAQMFELLRQEFGAANVVHAYTSTLDQVYLISSKRVRLTAGKASTVKTSSDHRMGVVPVTATEVT
jgi:endonuclease/exonuclease/phosphatase (EEP) superfamily protein YafD